MEKMNPNIPIPKKLKKEARPSHPVSHDTDAPIPKSDRKTSNASSLPKTHIGMNARIPKLDRKKEGNPYSSATDAKTGADIMNARIPKLAKHKLDSSHGNPSTQMGTGMDLKRKIPKADKKMPIVPYASESKQKTKPEAKPGTEKPFTMRISKLVIRHNKPLEFPRDSHVMLLSEKPMVLRINTAGIPMRMRSSGRSNKRKSYREKETDSDFLDTDSEDEKKKKKMRFKKDVKKSDTNTAQTVETIQIQQSGAVGAATDPGLQIDSPPPGVLPSLWYSRENSIHIWVIDKIIGWKKRPKVEMQWRDQSVYELDRDISRKVQDRLINHYIPDPRKRMEISRISPRKCPLVLKAVAEREERIAKTENRQASCFIKQNDSHEKEEVLLIKWRGRSYIHCSWERASDLERLDPTNNTAKGKVKRYYQSQYTAFGMNWKKVLEDNRKAEATAHGHGLQALEGGPKQQSPDADEDDENTDEDFFSPDFVEVERILACDENKLDMNVLSRQRDLNIRNEKEAEERRQRGLLRKGQQSSEILMKYDIMDESWDPEDYVRYVVKWKGLQVSEITWEYWLHIKHDSVTPVEDFWIRQQAPDPHEFQLTLKEHPHIREYKKLLESPKFGTPSARGSIGIKSSSNDESGQNSEDSAALCLRTYQLDGVNWMLWNWWNKRSCILADEMGLGKTIQSMAFLKLLQTMPATQVKGPFLIVAPLSLVSQWQSEAATWAPDMNVVLYHGSMDARKFLVDKEFYYNDQFVSKGTAQKLKRMHVTKFDVLITTYEVAMKDINVLSKIRWRALVVDEAHRLKNDQSRLFVELGNVPREFCLLLTGTPLQNSTGELWSLLHFCNSSNFSSKEEFVEKFGQLSDSKQVSELHSVLKPYLLRRVKEDVEKSLPPKEETILEVALTPIQKNYYKAIYERNTSFLFKGSKPSNAPSLMNIMMELRKCCNHPFLIKGAEDRIMQDAAAKNIDEDISDPLMRYRKILAVQLVQSSGKMVILMKLLPKLQSGGHKVLIFSQMVRVLDLLEELLKLNNYSYERLDGSTRASARTAAMSRFNKKSYNRFVMLLSTRAGGLGLNLTSADTVIIFDSDWNPQNDLQAMARAHRIGQTRSVKVYRFLTAKTYEMHMFHSASMKLGLDRAVLAHQRQQDDNEEKASSKKLSKESQAKEIDELLKKGAYDVFRDDDDSDAKTFFDTDIDQILERSSRTVTYGNTQSAISSSLGSFSKASFVTSGADGKDVDLDDPDFWTKAIGLEAPVAVSTNENILQEGEKRSRKQVQVFDPYADFQEEEELKKEKADLKLKLEKEEKKRLRDEKRIKREQEKERKKKEKDAARMLKSPKINSSRGDSPCASSKPSKSKEQTSGKKTKDSKLARDLMTKRLQRYEHRRMMRSIEEEDPIMAKIKQSWNAFHRDNVIRHTLLFGFGRFCKVRHETNLGGLPIQDIELFIRSYIFQLGLQAASSILDKAWGATSQELLQDLNPIDREWIAQSITVAVKKYDMHCNLEVELRMPQILAEQDFVHRLRSGEAVAALETLSLMSRFNAIVEQGADDALKELGPEELGKRGYHSKDSIALDIDMKMRYLSTEEVMFSVGKRLSEPWKIAHLCRQRPATWWDLSCDLGLIIGTFLHGLGNFHAMVSDNSLPFSQKYRCEADSNLLLRSERLRFVTEAVRCVFDDKLQSESSNINQEAEASNLNDESHNKQPKNLLINESSHQEPSEHELGTTDLHHTARREQNVVEGSRYRKEPVTTLSSLCKRMVKYLQKARMIDLQNNDQNIVTYVTENASKVEGRLFELMSIIESTESQFSTDRHRAHHWQHSPVYNNLCNALGLKRKIDFKRRQNTIPTSERCDRGVDLKVSDVSFGIPANISGHGVIALTCMDEKMVQLVSDLTMSSRSEKEIYSESNLPSDQMSKQAKLYIPATFREDESLRNIFCAAFFCLGTTTSPHFIPLLKVLAGSSEMSISEEDTIIYARNILLPHCAHLCLRYVKSQCIEGMIFPDPCSPLQDHSPTSVKIAVALLRKAKVYQTVSNAVLLPEKELRMSISKAAKSNNFPLWWNDDCGVKLLRDIAQNGVLHTSLQRSYTIEGSTFQPEFIKLQIRQYFFQESEVKSYILNKCSQQDVDDFIERQAMIFPDSLAIETYVSSVCNEISRNHIGKEWTFLDLPMPDHDLF